jgi:three-Cys-motif partner protein
MTWDHEFFSGERRLTSKLKHLVLRPYVKEFAYHLGSVHPIVYYVDGFAGAGVYTSESNREDGSPLLIARLAQELRTAPRGIQLRCLNVEADRERFESLEAATDGFKPHVVEHNYHSTFVDALPNILERIGDAATFFFIDPFGTKDIPFADLLPVFNRRHTTEVLITLQTAGIATKAGWFAKEDSSKPGERETARKLTEHLAAALDVSIAELRQAWRDSLVEGGTDALEERVRRWYVRRLKTSTRTRFKFSKSFKVLYRPADRKSSTCFHLVFATQNQKGLYEMNNAMASALEALYADLYSGTLFPEFAEEREQQSGRAAVRREILSHFAKSVFTIEDVKRYCMQETDCVLKEGDYRALVLQMRKNGELSRVDSGPLTKEAKFRVLRPPDAI